MFNDKIKGVTMGHVDGEPVSDVLVEGKGIAKKYTVPLKNGLQLKITREKGSNAYTGFGNIIIE